LQAKGLASAYRAITRTALAIRHPIIIVADLRYAPVGIIVHLPVRGVHTASALSLGSAVLAVIGAFRAGFHLVSRRFLDPPILTVRFACARGTQIEGFDAGTANCVVLAHGTADRTLDGNRCPIVIVACDREAPRGFIEQLSVVIGQVATQAVCGPITSQTVIGAGLANFGLIVRVKPVGTFSVAESCVSNCAAQIAIEAASTNGERGTGAASRGASYTYPPIKGSLVEESASRNALEKTTHWDASFGSCVQHSVVCGVIAGKAVALAVAGVAVIGAALADKNRRVRVIPW